MAGEELSCSGDLHYLLGQAEGTAKLLAVVVPGPHLHPSVNDLQKTTIKSIEIKNWENKNQENRNYGKSRQI